MCRCSTPGVGVEAAQQPLVEAAVGDDHVGEGVGDLLLRVAVAGKRAADGQDPHAAPRWSAGRGRVRGRRGGARPPARRGRDPAVAEAELDEGVERVPVAVGGPDAGVDDGGRPGPAARRSRCAAGGGPSRRRTARRCAAPASPRAPGRGRPRGGRAAGQDAGGDGVVDALARHRVDQRGGVADQQDAAVGLLPAPARQRQVVAAPVACRGHGARAAAPRAGRAAAPGWAPYRVAGPSGEQLAVADVGPARRRGRRPRRTPAGARSP